MGRPPGLLRTERLVHGQTERALLAVMRLMRSFVGAISLLIVPALTLALAAIWPLVIPTSSY